MNRRCRACAIASSAKPLAALRATRVNRIMLRDITHPRWLYLKGGLLLALGIFAASLLLIEYPHWKTVLLLAIAIWAFCRAYYFTFYVIEHYVDSHFRFAGLWSFVIHWWKRRSVPPAGR
jgi:hypothetical protein